EPGFIEYAQRAVEAQLLAAVIVTCPCTQAGEHLRCERFVHLPGIDVVQPESMALQDRRCGMYRSQSHLRGIESRPLRVDDATEHRKSVLANRTFGGEHQPGGAVGDL